MPEADLATLLAFFKAMANESRLRIVGLLAERERSVQELAALLELKEPTISHHLAALKACGLVSARAEGVVRWHALRLGTLTELNRSLLDQQGGVALAREVTPAENAWEAKVLASYVGPDGKLDAIPASRRKRLIVLKWLARQFQLGRRYREAEVNETLQRRHWDCATLRRELIGYGMMGREAGVYWLRPEAEWRETPEGLRS
ncbi:MAG TPA: metalloregulator ArsR/SmtB family transcription factor [Caulobacteraceae bacterium]|nr:metalloregulator ArsR/SmtB family transcription factor [Caulobacteraceae bacterium]